VVAVPSLMSQINKDQRKKTTHHTPPSRSSRTHLLPLTQVKRYSIQSLSTNTRHDSLLGLQLAIGDWECDVVHVEVEIVLGKGEGFA